MTTPLLSSTLLIGMFVLMISSWQDKTRSRLDQLAQATSSCQISIGPFGGAASETRDFTLGMRIHSHRPDGMRIHSHRPEANLWGDSCGVSFAVSRTARTVAVCS